MTKTGLISTGNPPGRAPRAPRKDLRDSPSAQQVLRTVVDPEATEILTSIALEPATSAEIAEALGLEPEQVRTRLRRLRDSGQAVSLGMVRRRARPEHLYAVDQSGSTLDSADLDRLPRQQVDEAELAVLRLMFREAVAAVEARLFHFRDDWAQTRFPILLDTVGLGIASRLHRDLISGVIEEATRARVRLTRSDERPIPTSIFILLFDHPTDLWPHTSTAPQPLRRRVARRSVKRIVDLMRDPLSDAIVEALVVAPAGATELAARCDLPVGRVRYAIEHLLDDGIVTVSARRRRRGTIERVFALEPRQTVLGAEELAASSGPELEAFSRWMLTKTFKDALEAMRVADPSRPHLIARIPTALDVQGFARISAMIERTVEALFELRERDLQDRDASRPRARLAISDLMLFERLPPRSAASKNGRDGSVAEAT